MLRSWTERLQIYLHPNRIVLVRLAGIYRLRLIEKRVITIDASLDGPIWNATAVALQKALENPEWQGLSATVILSGRFVRYRVARWDDRLTQLEREALLRHQFEDVYGQSMRTWNIFVGDGQFRKHGLACAIDALFLETLQQLFKASAVRLKSIEPFFIAAANHWRKTISGNAWLIFVEPAGINIAQVSEGSWQSLRYKPSDIGSASDIELMLAREQMHSASDMAGNSRIYLFWPENPEFKPNVSKLYDIKALRLDGFPGFSAMNDRQCAVAMCR